MCIYLVLINMAGFFTMYRDKKKAEKNKWRISEKQICLLALIGGATGALAGMYIFRHKTKHRMFVLLLPIATILQWLLIYEMTVNNGDVINQMDRFIR